MVAAIVVELVVRESSVCVVAGVVGVASNCVCKSEGVVVDVINVEVVVVVAVVAVPCAGIDVEFFIQLPLPPVVIVLLFIVVVVVVLLLLLLLLTLLIFCCCC